MDVAFSVAYLLLIMINLSADMKLLKLWEESFICIDVDLCLYPHSMSALEKDDEFLDALNFS